MSDTYTFDTSPDAAKETYDEIMSALCQVLDDVEVPWRREEADGGEIGGDFTEELVVTTPTGDLEVAHSFLLGHKYSEPFGAVFGESPGTPLFMGCYGLGITRLFAVLADLHRTDTGFTWPRGFAPLDAVVILAPTHPTTEMLHEANELATSLDDAHDPAARTVIVDDRPLKLPRKLEEATALGYPNVVVVGKRGVEWIKKEE
jgi:prolyl-tRNA synthetase